MGNFIWNQEDGIISGAVVHKDSSVLSPPTISGDVNDYSPDGFKDVNDNIKVSMLRLQTNDLTSRSITGISASSDLRGNVVTIRNIGDVSTQGNLSLSSRDVASSVGNRFEFHSDVPVTLEPDEAASFIYDTDREAWMITSDYR